MKSCCFFTVFKITVFRHIFIIITLCVALVYCGATRRRQTQTKTDSHVDHQSLSLLYYYLNSRVVSAAHITRGGELPVTAPVYATFPKLPARRNTALSPQPLIKLWPKITRNDLGKNMYQLSALLANMHSKMISAASASLTDTRDHWYRVFWKLAIFCCCLQLFPSVFGRLKPFPVFSLTFLLVPVLVNYPKGHISTKYTDQPGEENVHWSIAFHFSHIKWNDM